MSYRIPRPKAAPIRRPEGFTLTSKSKPCWPMRGGCKTQLVFDNGQPYLRLCESPGQPGPLVEVNSGSEAADVAREACECFEGTGGYECDNVPRSVGLGSSPAMVYGAQALSGLPGFKGLRSGGVGKVRKYKTRKRKKAGSPKWMSCRSVGKLTAAKEKKLPDAAFGLIEKKGGKKQRKYPMPDPSHARNAKARASAEYKRGALSKAKRDKIFKKADRVMAACKR